MISKCQATFSQRFDRYKIAASALLTELLEGINLNKKNKKINIEKQKKFWNFQHTVTHSKGYALV
jgi:hypothetical protein